MNKSIVVNATALRSGGALTILKQFVEAIPNDESRYILFVDKSIHFKSADNVRFVYLNKRSFLKRFLWDAFGVKKWLKKNNISPLAAISLQNTNFRIGSKCPNYIYYHQPAPLFPYKWNPLRKEQRGLWFYKNCYPIFVKLFLNSQTEFFVQLRHVKDAFCSKYKVSPVRVHVIAPHINPPQYVVNKVEKDSIKIDERKTNLFYPAAYIFYKNHDILFKAFFKIDTKLSKKIVLYLSNFNFNFNFNFKNIEVVTLGIIPYEEVIALYSRVNALVFPSYIETFGLPLTEAAFFGLPIIAADLPYAKEVLDGYEGVTFVNHQDAEAWGEAILKLCLTPTKCYSPFRKEGTNSWATLFEIIKQKI